MIERYPVTNKLRFGDPVHIDGSVLNIVVADGEMVTTVCFFPGSKRWGSSIYRIHRTTVYPITAAWLTKNGYNVPRATDDEA